MHELITSTIDSWKGKRRGESPPFRYEFDSLNQDIQFLLKYDPENGHKIRLAGLFFESLIGTSLTGRSLPSLFEPEQQTEVNHVVDRLFNGPAIAKLKIVANEKELLMALLPVRADHGPIEFAIGVINIETMPIHSQPKLKYLSSEVVELRKSAEAKVMGFAEDKSSFNHQKTPKFQVINGEGSMRADMRKIELELVKSFKREP